MSRSPIVYTIDKPHFTLKLHEEELEVDLKEGLRKEFEDLAENRPFLKETLGMLYQFAGPLDVKLKDIEKVATESDGRVKVVIPHRRDLHIPLAPDEAETLMKKLDELIPEARRRAAELEKIATAAAAQHASETDRYRDEVRRRPG